MASIIIVTRYADRSIEVEDFGRGCPVDWNEKEQRYNWELVFCELYAGGKYNNNDGENYEYSPRPERPRHLRHAVCLGVYGRRGSSETASNITCTLKRARIDGQMEKKPADRKKTGSLYPLEAGPRGLHGHRHPAWSIILTRSSGRPSSTRA